MHLETLDVPIHEVQVAAQEAYNDGAIDENSIPYKVLKEVLKRRPTWRGVCTEEGETICIYGPAAWTSVSDLSNTVGAILHLDGSAFLPVG